MVLDPYSAMTPRPFATHVYGVLCEFDSSLLDVVGRGVWLCVGGHCVDKYDAGCEREMRDVKRISGWGIRMTSKESGRVVLF